MTSKPPLILVIAGSDSGGGAGIQADIKTITMLGGHATTAIAAVTAQNGRGVSAIHKIPTEMVIAQIDAVFEDFTVDAIKIGMIGSAETAEAVADKLTSHSALPIVFDPVMVATSGAVLADDATIAAFRKLMAIATVTTPNLIELEALGGVDAMTPIADNILVKGGHSPGDMITERLYAGGSERKSWTDPRIRSNNMHGTGCVLASAITCGLGDGMTLEDAIGRARRFVRLAIERAPDLVENNGPLGLQSVRREEVE